MANEWYGENCYAVSFLEIDMGSVVTSRDAWDHGNALPTWNGTIKSTTINYLFVTTTIFRYMNLSLQAL